MASDLQFTQSNAIKWKGKTKIYKFDPHPDVYNEEFIVGIAGSANDLITVSEFFYNPEAFKRVPKVNCNGLVLTKSGRIYTFTELDKWLYMDVPFAAVGSGSPAALGALHAGASPKEAVQAAMKVDPFTGLGIKQLSF